MNLPSDYDIYLQWILNPFDPAWLRDRHPVILHDIAGYIGLHQLSRLHADPTIYDFLRQSALAPGLVKSPLATRVFAELQWLRGDWEALEDWISDRTEPELQAVAAALVFLKGDPEQAIGRFDQALQALRKETGKRTAYFYGLAGVIYPLAIMKLRGAERLAKLPNLLAQAVKMGGLWTEIYRYLALFHEFQQGDLQRRPELLAITLPFKSSSGFGKGGRPEAAIMVPTLLQHAFLWLIQFWTDAEHFTKVGHDQRALYAHLQGNGYRWIAAEVAKVFAKIDPAEAECWDAGFLANRPLALAELFASRPDWDLALDALLNITSQGGKGADYFFILRQKYHSNASAP